ncbi:MAG: menaquinone biosynthesis protein [Planctomycetia bacterium]|nr:menaquinone biosynthesis protein [Planctomycetia bacterium]
MEPVSKIRVGAVSYLNTRPLIYGLEELAPRVELVLDVPSRLADDLAAGRLDVALVPSIEYFRGSAYEIVSDACIACRGPVLSVKMFSRVPVPEIGTLALDDGSRTSAVLVQILLNERYGVRPRIEPLPVDCGLADSGADAVLLIGDRAIQSPGGRFAAVWDLGDEWCRWAGLPFVFAMWVAHAGRDLPSIEAALGRARDQGVENLEGIAASEAAGLGLTRPECLSYLRDCLHFRLGDLERRGLELYRDLAVKLGFLESSHSGEPYIAARTASGEAVAHAGGAIVRVPDTPPRFHRDAVARDAIGR